VPGTEYALNFNYRWISGSGGNYTMDAVISDEATNAIIESVTLSIIPDQWFSETLLFTAPEEVTNIRVLFSKGSANESFSINNVTVLENIDVSLDADYIYKNGAWSPSSPVGVSTGSDDILIFNSYAEITSALIANNFEVKSWADADIISVLKLSGDIIADGKLNFKSDQATTAQLDEFSGTITGDVTVERYISAKRAFRFVSTAVTTPNSIFENWQEGGEIPIELGTHITGSTTDANGFDATQTGNASLFTFDNSIADPVLLIHLGKQLTIQM